MAPIRFEVTDPEAPPATELLAEMETELNELYRSRHRLAKPKLSAHELRAPSGRYLVAWRDQVAIAGGGLRCLAPGMAEIKRMWVRPPFRSQGVAAELLAALEAAAVSMGYGAARLDTGPKQVHAIALYKTAGYREIGDYNGNPFACYWGEKELG